MHLAISNSLFDLCSKSDLLTESRHSSDGILQRVTSLSKRGRTWWHKNADGRTKECARWANTSARRTPDSVGSQTGLRVARELQEECLYTASHQEPNSMLPTANIAVPSACGHTQARLTIPNYSSGGRSSNRPTEWILENPRIISPPRHRPPQSLVVSMWGSAFTALLTRFVAQTLRCQHALHILSVSVPHRVWRGLDTAQGFVDF